MMNIKCEDIRVRLKPFLDDVLTEEEHAAFCAHLHTCSKCNDHVRSIGSFSNQIWKLGKVKPPEDLSATIIYRLTHPVSHDQPAISALPVVQITGIALVLMAAAILVGTAYFRSHHKVTAARKQAAAETQAAPMEKPAELAPFEQEYENEPEPEVSEEGVLKQEPVVPRPAAGRPAGETPAPKVQAAGNAAVSQSGVLHWHFKYFTGADMSRLLGILSGMGIKPAYEGKNELIIASSGEKAERLLEQLLELVKGKSSFTDFTPDVATYFGKEYLISVYSEDGETAVLHWHIDPVLVDKRGTLIETIKEFSSSVDYESERSIVFSISDQQLINLKRRLQAMRVIVSEYGAIKHREGILSSGPLTISVYFVK